MLSIIRPDSPEAPKTYTSFMLLYSSAMGIPIGRYLPSSKIAVCVTAGRSSAALSAESLYGHMAFIVPLYVVHAPDLSTSLQQIQESVTRTKLHINFPIYVSFDVICAVS